MHLHPKAARNGVMPYMHWLAKCADGVSIYLAGVITFWAYFGYPIWQWERYQWMTALSSLMGVFVLSGCGVYRSWRGALRAPLLLRLTQGFLYLAGMIAGYLYLTKAGHHFSRLWFGIWLGTAFALCIMSRLIAYWLLSRLRASGHNTRSLALIGNHATCREVFRSIRRDPLAGFVVRQIRLLDADEALFNDVEDVRRYDPARDGEPPCDEIWICLPLTPLATSSTFCATAPPTSATSPTCAASVSSTTRAPTLSATTRSTSASRRCTAANA